MVEGKGVTPSEIGTSRGPFNDLVLLGSILDPNSLQTLVQGIYGIFSLAQNGEVQLCITAILMVFHPKLMGDFSQWCHINSNRKRIEPYRISQLRTYQVNLSSPIATIWYYYLRKNKTNKVHLQAV